MIINNKKFKYDIIHKTSVTTYEKLPKYFLADNPIEAEKLYTKFNNLLNNIAYTYSILSGIPKSDLFGEALLGLARANRDWDKKYNSSFKTYAVFRIKDVLNEYIRCNAQIVIIPSYIKKGNILLNKIKALLKKFEISSDDIYKAITIANVKNIDIPNKQKIICNGMLKKLKAAAIRAKIDYKKFIKRIECLPIDFIIDSQTESSFQNIENEKLNTAILVKKLKKYMNKNEIIICDYIMFGLTYKEIGAKFCKSDAWVAKQVKNLRKRLLTRLKKEDI